MQVDRAFPKAGRRLVLNVRVVPEAWARAHEAPAICAKIPLAQATCGKSCAHGSNPNPQHLEAFLFGGVSRAKDAN